MTPHSHKVQFYLAAILNYLIAAIPWAFALDWITKLVTLAIACFGFWYMRHRHLQDMRNKKLEEETLILKKENLEQEQYQLLAKNKLLKTINRQNEEKEDGHVH